MRNDHEDVTLVDTTTTMTSQAASSLISREEHDRESSLRLFKLAEQMRNDISIEDRRHNLKIYKQCFLQSDALKWLQLYLPKVAASSSYEEAIKVANCMIDAGYVSHVKDEKYYRRRFDSHKKPPFFRFHNDKLLLSAFLMERRHWHTHYSLMEENQHKNSTHSVQHCTPDNACEVKALKEVWNSIGTTKTNISLLSDAFLYVTKMVQEEHSNTFYIVLSESCVLLLLLMGLTIAEISSPPMKRTVALVLLFQVLLLMYLTLKRNQNKNDLECQKRLLETIAMGLVEEIQTTATDGDKAKDAPTDSAITPLLLRNASLRASFRHLRDVTKKMQETLTCSVKGSAVAENEYSLILRQRDTIPPPCEWPHYPVLVNANNTMTQQRINVFKYKDGALPLGIPFEFESELFRGTALFRFKDVPSNNEDGTMEYFSGRQRRFQAIVQGRFKERLSCADVITGHEFDHSFQLLPPNWVIGAGTSLIKQLAPGVQIDLNSSKPKFFSLLAATSQAISVDKDTSTSELPDICSRDIPENCSALGDEFYQKSSSSRKKMLSDPKEADRFTYDTESVYTFDFYQHLLDVSSYKLNLGLIKLGISESLNNQPIQILAKTTDNRYLWSFCIWHTSLMPPSSQT